MSIFTVKIKLKKESNAYASVLNEMAEYLESIEPPPDHWDIYKKRNFYTKLRRQCSIKAFRMLAEILDVTREEKRPEDFECESDNYWSRGDMGG